MKKNLMTVLILALLIVNIALTGVMLVSIVGTNKKTAQLVDNITTDGSGSGGDDECSSYGHRSI